MARGKKATIALTAAALLLAAAVASSVYLVHLISDANPQPSPRTANPTFVLSLPQKAASEWPDVDWDYWQQVNPDVIGWITIPGTSVNHPICQAHADDPDYYLWHDVYREYNIFGALYLDAECEELGLSSPNAVILGHHTNGAETAVPFSCIADYKDQGFAAEHAAVLIQTPTARMRYEVRFADIVRGWEPTKRTSFEGEADWRSWYDASRDEAVMTLDGTTEPNQVISLVSCSYNLFRNNGKYDERTVVFTSQTGEGGSQAGNG